MKTLKWVVKLVGTAVLIYIVVTKVDISKVWQTVQNASIGPMILAFLFYIMSRFLGARRLRKIIEPTGLVIPLWLNLRLYWIGMFYSLLLPGGIGGDAYKVYYLKKRYPDERTLHLTSLILWDRIIGFVILLVLAMIPASFLFLEGLWKWISIPAAGATFIAAWFAIKWLKPVLLPVFVPLMAISIGIQLSQVAAFIAILDAIGIRQQFFEYALLFLGSSIASMLPISVGGIGLRAFTFMYCSQLLAIAEAPAVAASFLFDVLVIIVSLVGGFLMLKNTATEKQKS